MKDTDISLVQNAIEQLEKEIDFPSQALINVPLIQKNSMLSKLYQMKRNILNQGKRTDLGLGYVVIDSWPLSTDLGTLLIKTERIYLES